MKKEVKHASFSYKRFEFILAVIISILLIGSLLSQTYLDFPFQVASALLLVFILLKAVRIIAKGGTILDEYVSLGLIIIFWILHLITREAMGPFIIIIFTILLLHTIGLIPKIDKLIQSRSIGSFISSYTFFLVIVILLFAGAYSVNNTEFTENNIPTTLNFEDALYFSTVTFTTVGYGDIAPLGINRLMASLESLVAIILNIAFIGYILASRKTIENPNSYLVHKNKKKS